MSINENEKLNEMSEFLLREFPQSSVEVVELSDMACKVKQRVDERHLRPGGTVSGPTMFAVADCAIYVAILNEIGFVALAVTTNLNINFLRKPAANKDIIGECKIMKMGKSLVVADVFLYSEGMEEPVAHAVGTYSIPPRRN